MNPKQAWALTRNSMSAWSSDFAPSMGAALSYYTLFSIAPLLIIVIATAGLVFGADAVRGVIFDQLHALMGEEGAEAIQDMLASASDTTTGGIATVVSIAGLAIGKSDVTSSFGTAASLVIVMVWVYYASQIFLFGAELTRVYAETHGSRREQPTERRVVASKTGRRRDESAMGDVTPA